MKVKKIRYFKTRNGLGYEAKTDKGSIWNDGNGGGTYFVPDYNKGYRNRDFDFTEDNLESLINIYEGINE